MILARNDMNVFDAVSLFRNLTERNVLARKHGFRFEVVSDLEGFSDALAEMQLLTPLVCVSDTCAGSISIDNAPSTRRVNTVFLFMPHGIMENWMSARQERFSIMRELFRQFMSVLLREVTNLHLDGIYIDRDISFTEIDRYFFSGGACAYFQIASDITTDLQLNLEEWTENPIPPRRSRLGKNLPRHSTPLSSPCGTSSNTSASVEGQEGTAGQVISFSRP